MDSVTNSITISGPAEAVFDLVTSARFWTRWHPATESVAGVVERPYRIGDLVHERGQIAGVKFLVSWRVVEHSRPSRVVIQSDNPPARILYAFTGGEKDGVLFTRELKYDPAVFHVVGPQAEDLRRLMHQQSEQALSRLKQLVEVIIATESQAP